MTVATRGSMTLAIDSGVPVAYVPGLVMRRAADLYPGESKTDRRDAFVLADTGRTRRHQVHWLDADNDELPAQLRVLNGYDADLAADATRLSNRLRDTLTGISPAVGARSGPETAPSGRAGSPCCAVKGAAGAGTTASRTRCSSRPSLRCATLPRRAYCDRKRAKGKKHNAAVICLARRRSDVILTMLRLRQPYRPRRPRHKAAVAQWSLSTSAHDPAGLGRNK